MDLLYARYSNPMELISTYINRRRFAEFVRSFLVAENDRRKAEADKDEEWHYWMAYIHSYSDKSYTDWKDQILGRAKGKQRTGADHDLDDRAITAIMDKIFPSRTKG